MATAIRGFWCRDTRGGPRVRSRRLRLLTRLTWAAVAGCLAGAVAGWASGRTLHVPQLERIGSYRPPAAGVFRAADGEPVASFALERRVELRPEQVPARLKLALVAAEDARFYRHGGVDPLAVLRAAIGSLRTGRLGGTGGGSTITQQLALNLFLSRDRTLSRKAREAVLAMDLEKRLSKDQILTLYANQVYLGRGAWGVEAASQLYFGVPVGDLTLAQTAMIAGMIPSPENRFNPTRNPEGTLRRRNRVLDRMRELGFVPPAEARAAAAQPLGASTHRERAGAGEFFVEEARRRVVAAFGRDALYRDGLQVDLTMDPALQEAADAAVREGLLALDQSLGFRRPVNVERDRLEAALVAMDNRTGAILAMVGGFDFGRSEFNRATQAARQCGSTFKPFVYLTAFERGFTPSDTVLDAPFLLPDGRGRLTYCPRNYHPVYYGVTTFRRAVEGSYNASAVKVQELVGREAVVDTARRFGVGDDLLPYPSLALGSMEARLVDVVRAYAGIANLGEVPEPYMVSAVRDREGRVLEAHEVRRDRVMASPPVYLMLHAMRGVIARGTASAASSLPGDLAGKTGTTDDLTDAWFVGFSPRITVGVWVGRDARAPIGPGMTGAVAALPIWSRFMAAYLESLPEEDRHERFPVPPGVVFAPVHRLTGLRLPPGEVDAVDEAFLDGTDPIAAHTPELGALMQLPWPFQLPSYTPHPGEPMPSPEAVAIADQRLR